MAYKYIICKNGHIKSKAPEGLGGQQFVASSPRGMTDQYEGHHPNYKRVCPVCLNQFASRLYLALHHCGDSAAGAAVGGGGIVVTATGAPGGDGGIAGGAAAAGAASGNDGVAGDNNAGALGAAAGAV